MFDTSCVHALLAKDLEQEVYRQLPLAQDGCKFWTGLYLRMEFFRVWVISGIDIYNYAKRFNSVPKALDYLGEEFSIRYVKSVLKWAAYYIKELRNKQETEEIYHFGWLVLNFALEYDNIFQKIAQPKTNCKRGQTPFDFSMPSLDKILTEFYERFNAEDHTCKLSSLLQISGTYPKLQSIMRADLKSLKQESRKSIKDLRENIQFFITNSQTPTCKDCYKIGDVLVALDQPPNTKLYHTDYSFSALCPILKHKHEHIISAKKVLKGLNEQKFALGGPAKLG